MANATVDFPHDLANHELDALRISRSSGPTTDSTVSAAAAAAASAPLLQVPGEQDTSPTSETSEPSSVSSSSRSQQHQQQDNNCGGCGSDNGNKSEKNDDKSHYNTNNKYTILCDMSYDMPREARPRKEKIRAIARQLVNFLSWQQHQSSLASDHTTTNALEESSSISLLPLQQHQPALVKIVGCADAAIEQSLKDRMLELWVQQQQEQAAATTATTATGGNCARKQPSVINLPNNLTFTQQSLESFLATTHTEGNRKEEEEDEVDDCHHDKVNTTTGDDHDHDGHHQQRQAAIYLSPDASVALDPGQPPPSMVVVGLLIDRTHVQVNRSLKRAQDLFIPAARWPLEKIVLLLEEEDDDNCKNNMNSSSSSTFVSTTDSCNDDKKKKSATTTTNNTPITLHASEPLNCDCILEGMQQWYWNYEKYVLNQQTQQEACRHHPAGGDSDHDDDNDTKKKKKKAAQAAREQEACFSDAILQALQHHVQRHPGRPIHKKTDEE